MKKKTTISAEEFDRRFEGGEDVTDYLDYRRASRPGLESRRVNVDFPQWMVEALDREAGRVGVTRQSIIKMWIGEKLMAAERAKAS